MAQDGQNVEMQDRPDGCLSTVDEEEREPCLKKTEETAAADGKNNGTVPAASAADGDASATAAAAAAPPPSADNNNTGGNAVKNGKFRALAAATSLERKLRDQTGYSRTGLFVAAVVALLCLVLFAILVVLLFKWPRPSRPMHVCRSASCLRASAEVSLMIIARCTHVTRGSVLAAAAGGRREGRVSYDELYRFVRGTGRAPRARGFPYPAFSP